MRFIRQTRFQKLSYLYSGGGWRLVVSTGVSPVLGFNTVVGYIVLTRRLRFQRLYIS